MIEQDKFSSLRYLQKKPAICLLVRSNIQVAPNLYLSKTPNKCTKYQCLWKNYAAFNFNAICITPKNEQNIILYEYGLHPICKKNM